MKTSFLHPASSVSAKKTVVGPIRVTELVAVPPSVEVETSRYKKFLLVITDEFQL